MKIEKNVPNKRDFHAFSLYNKWQNFNPLKQNINFINNGWCILVSLLIVLATILLTPVLTADYIEWDVTLNFNESGGEFASVVFGEAYDANDGPPADSYDVPLCPVPPEPYIRAWFDDGLSYPYGTLWEDYRKYSVSNTYKIWNLTVHWQASASTVMTITWDSDEVDDSEYGYVVLFDVDSSTIVADMLVDTSHTFMCHPWSNSEFQLIATIAGNNPPTANDDDYNTNEDTMFEVAIAQGILSNDVDNDGPLALTAELIDDVSHGTLSLSDDGSFEYNPEKDWNGADIFTYKAYDGRGYSDSATVTITVHSENDSPYTPSNPNPENDQTNVCINVDLSWVGGDPDLGDTVTYDVYFGTSSSPSKISSNQSSTFYDPGKMNYETTYYWKIISWDNLGKYAEGPVWHFTLEEEPEPSLEIELISGGFGISTVIENVGNVDATDVEWSISLDGGIILRPSARIKKGTIPMLVAGDTITKSTSVLGLGRIDITVMVGEVEKTTKGFMLLFIVVVISE